MIKTLTPYYLNIPFVSPFTGLVCDSFTLKLYVWSGLKTSLPSEPSYVITIENPEQLETERKINISNLINSSLEFNVQTLSGNTLNNGNNQMWCKQSVFYNTAESQEMGLPQVQNTLIFTKGYGYAMEGENPSTPTDKVLMQGREFKVSNSTNFTIPLVMDEIPPPSPNILVTNVNDDGSGVFTFTFTSTGSFGGFNLIFIGGSQSFPFLTSNTSSPQTFDTESEESFIGFYMIGYDSNSGIEVISNTFTI